MKKIFFFLMLYSLLVGEEVRVLVLSNGEKGLISDSEKFSQTKGLVSVGLTIPGGKDKLANYLFPIYRNKPFSENMIGALQQAIFSYYQEEGYPFVLIEAPSSTLQNGALQLNIVQSKIASVEVKGNAETQVQEIRNKLNLKANEPIYVPEIQRKLSYFNRNPFQDVILVYSPGQRDGTTDLAFHVDTRKPYQFYAGSNNSGVATTERNRAYIGVALDHLFGFNQTFNYQFCTSYNFSSFLSHIAEYTAYINPFFTIELFGGYSTVQADLTVPNRKNLGRNMQASLRFLFHAWTRPKYSLTAILGGDWKNTNNNIEFLEIAFPPANHSVNISQFIVGLEGDVKDSSMHIRWKAALYDSPAELLANQENSRFNALREGAKNYWVYVNGFLDIEKNMPQYIYRFLLQAQVSNNLLIPAEQFGIGGYNTVRGYNERQISADSGFSLSQEIGTRFYSLFHKNSKIRLLAFLDGGWGVDYERIDGIIPKTFLLGAGPAIRYSFGSYIFARADLGFKLHHKKSFSGGHAMLYFNVSTAY